MQDIFPLQNRDQVCEKENLEIANFQTNNFQFNAYYFL